MNSFINKDIIVPFNYSGNKENIKKIVVIGTSTGGPRALQEVIPLIPEDVPAAFLIVQHMPSGFTKSLAERLNNLSMLTVKEAEDNEIIRPGFAYVAPGSYHMMVKKNEHGELKIKISSEPSDKRYKPSVDVLLNSLTETQVSNVICVIMTGMGSDGSKGIVNLKRKSNGYIIAQDEKTSVVYGMPKAAVKTGMVDAIVPLNEIADHILKTMGVYK
ncbi:MAG TPA: chemotaxis protein CheB [Clostridiaceae bacterium]|nr:chemotaxis protein CheB [Clostridiaceae bacterium]